MSFTLCAGTAVGAYPGGDGPEAVENAAGILRRDLEKRFGAGPRPVNAIDLENAVFDRPETFAVEVTAGKMAVRAGDAPGFVYGLLYISERFLRIPPFWFWMDVQIGRIPPVSVPDGVYTGKKPAVRYRGWFINDEVLLKKWSINGDPSEPWRMAFEALLRCGGNMVIPGTDKDGRLYRDLASSYGLWLSHHHAEALGAEFFLREYPDLEPNYDEHPALFQKQWEDAVRAQRDKKVVWCLGFRGQGDAPFWASDTTGRYDTDEKRGAMISKMLRLQRRLVEKYVPAPVFCTNLYGEVMELYAQGFVDIDPDVIKIRADNGFGKMVTRRRGNHDPRVSALPEEREAHGGIYYHVSFYDLQAANHMTMFPNSVDLVDAELNAAMEKGLSEYWMINCSNIRPHVYLLDAVRKKWFGEPLSDEVHSRSFAESYFGGSEAVAACYRAYSAAQLAFGPEPDQHAGEQFYCEIPRMIAHQFFIDRHAPAPGLRWLTDAGTLAGQARYFGDLCRAQTPKLQALWERCEKSGAADITLHARLQALGAQAGALLGDGFEALEKGDFLAAFMAFGDASERFREAAGALKAWEKGVFQGFTDNDCFADYKHTAYMLEKLMGCVRELGDSPAHDRWYRLAYMDRRDRPIRALLVEDNHPTDRELYIQFQSRKERENG